ncbi:hypothetical protein TNCV_4699721 [Trichonephila clavipes]|nr:hypothetical protein TNCV_4699721 [Trichonephila clavipes]
MGFRRNFYTLTLGNSTFRNVISVVSRIQRPEPVRARVLLQSPDLLSNVVRNENPWWLRFAPRNPLVIWVVLLVMAGCHAGYLLLKIACMHVDTVCSASYECKRDTS